MTLSKQLIIFSSLAALPLSTYAAGSAWAPGVSQESGWHDVNKSGSGDGSLCWAAQSSNMLQFWQDNYVALGNDIATGTPDGFVSGGESATRRQYQIFEYFVENWTNKGGYNRFAIPWYMTGEFHQSAPGGSISQVKTDATGTGGFFTDVYSDASALCGSNFNGDFQYSTYADYAAFSSFLIDAFTVKNAVVGLEFFYVNSAGDAPNAHAITIWGCEYDDDGLVTKVFLTDSDDGAVKLSESKITVDGTRVYLDPTHSGYTNRVTKLSSLSFSSLLFIPEPSAFGLLAGLAALAFAGTRRRRK